MQRVIACTLLLAVCCPVLVISKKVVFMVPHQIRRSPSSAGLRSPLIHNPSYHAKRSYYPNVPKRPYDPSSVYYGKLKPYGYDKRKLPHGGDDFDQGHEGIRHITIPHGKGISHGISFGRGYIPYNKIKSDFTRIPSQENSRPDLSYSTQSGPGPTATEALNDGSSSQFSPSSFSPSAFNYNDRNPTSAESSGAVREKYTNGFQPTVDSSGNPSQAVNYVANKGENFKALSLIQNILPAEQQHTQNQNQNVVPINANGKGIVISDSVLLDDYNKKIEEFTNSWPKIVAMTQPSVSNTQQASPSVLLGTINVPSVSNGKRSYSVHEDVQEPSPTNLHRIISSPFQLGQSTKNVDVSSLISVQG